jgi:hypothetical protein
MSKTRTKKHPTERARAFARKTADDYFAGLSREIPYDNAPGDVELVTACTLLEDILRQDDPKGASDDPADIRHFGLLAGYLLGIEIGRRLGGAR